MPGPARRSRRTRNEPPEIGLPKSDEGEHNHSQDVKAQETIDDENQKEEPEDQNDESDEEGRTHSEDKQRSRKRDESPQKSTVAATTRRSNRVRKPTSRSSSRVSSPAPPGTKAKVRSRTTNQSDDQQSKDTDEANSGHASAVDESSSSSSSSEEEDEDKSKQSQEAASRRQPRRSKRARLYPTPDDLSRSEETRDQEIIDKKDKSRGDQSCASTSSERKKSDVNDNDNDDDFSDNEPLSVLMKRKKEKLKKATMETSSTDGNDQSRGAHTKRPLSSAASSVVDEDEEDKGSGDDNVKHPNDSKSKPRRKRQAPTSTNTDNSHRSSGDEHDANGPPLKKKRGRKLQSSKKSVSEPSTNDELSSDESVVKSVQRSTRTRRRKENAAGRALPTTIQEQDENDDDHDRSANVEESKIMEGTEGSNDNTQSIDSNPMLDDEHKKGNKSSESKRTTRQRSDSHADDEASEEMLGPVESSRRSQRRRRKPRKLGGGESSEEDDVGTKEATDTDTEIKEQSDTLKEKVTEEDSQEVMSEPQHNVPGLTSQDESQLHLPRRGDDLDVDMKTNRLDAGDGIEEQPTSEDAKEDVTERQAEDNIHIKSEALAETTHSNHDNKGSAVPDSDYVMDKARESEDTNKSIEKDTEIESGSSVIVEGEGIDSKGARGIPDELAVDKPINDYPASENAMSSVDLSKQTDTLSHVADVASFQQKDRPPLASPEPTNSGSKQGLDPHIETQSSLPTASPASGEHHQLTSYESSAIPSDSREESGDDRTKPVLEQIDETGGQTMNASISTGEGQPKSSESLILEKEIPGQTQESVVPEEQGVFTVTSNAGEPSSLIPNQEDSDLTKLSRTMISLSKEKLGTDELEALNGEENNNHTHEGDAFALVDISRALLEANRDTKRAITDVSLSEKRLGESSVHSSVDEGAVIIKEAREGVNVNPFGQEAIIEPPAEKKQAITKSKKEEDEENDHFHDAQMELPPEPQISINLSPIPSEPKGNTTSEDNPTSVAESLDEESAPTVHVTPTTSTQNETLEEDKQGEPSNDSMLATTPVPDGFPEGHEADVLSTPLNAAETTHHNVETEKGHVLSPLPHDASWLAKKNAVSGSDFNISGPQINQGTSLQSGDAIEIAVIPTEMLLQVDEDTLRAQEGGDGTTFSMEQPKAVSTNLETVNQELKTSEEAIQLENPEKDTSATAEESSDYYMSPKSVTYPQASDQTKGTTSKPANSSSDSNASQVLPKMHEVDASAPTVSSDMPVEELGVEPDSSTPQTKLPTIQSLVTDGGPNSSADAKSTPDLWVLPFDLDYKVKFGPSIPSVSKLSNSARRNCVDGSDTDKMKRVKAALYAAGSKAHRGAGFERIFAEYWDAMALRLSDRLSSHTSDRCQQAIDNFLTTSKLRKLHNRFVISILRRATKSTAVYDEISCHVPSKWRSRINVICKKIADPPTEQLNVSDLLANCAFESMEPVYREAWHQDQPEPKPIGNESRRQKSVTGPKLELASCNIPGALTVDPLVRKIAEECDMQVSELAVWMMVVAVREHATNVLRAALSQKEGMEQQELVPRTLRFPNVLANATKPPPKKDSNQESGKPSTADKAARAQRKLTVLDIYAGSSTMPCGNVGSLGGSLSRDVLERSLHAAFDHLPVVPKDDFVQVQHFITDQIFGEARTRKVPTKSREDERETRADDVNRNVNVTMKQRNSFAVPAPAPAQTRQPQVPAESQVTMEAQAKAIPNEVQESTHQDLVTPTPDASIEDSSGQKSLPRGMGRGAKDLAALMRRTSTSTPPIQENVVKDNDGTAAGDGVATPEETLPLDSAHAGLQDESCADGEDAMGQRRGKGFGIKNLAAMRARAGNDSQSSNNAS